MGREILKDHRITKSLRNQVFQDTTFDGLTIFSRRVADCEFSNVHFKHCQLGSNTKYSNCKFINCKMEGKYSTLGSTSSYINCSFENCMLKGNLMFMGVIFEHCHFSGTFANNIFIDEKRWFRNYYSFSNCDLLNVSFENVTFNSERTFKACRLPEKGIRRLRNDNNSLINFINSRPDSELTNSIRVLFHGKLKGNQNPIFFDEETLNTFLQPDELRLFEQLTNGFEV